MVLFTKKYIRLMSANPFRSRPVNANVCVAVVEPEGVAAANVGGTGVAPANVQVLACTQPVPVPGVPNPLRLGDVFSTIGAVQWAGVAVLAIIGLERPGLLARRWRISGPAVAMGLAVLMSNAGWSGVVLVTRRALSMRADGQVVLGSEVALLEGFTAGVVAAAAMATALAIVAAVRAGGNAAVIPPADAQRVPRPLWALQRAIRGIDLIGTAGVGVSFGVGLCLFIHRFQPPADWLAPWPVQIQGPDAGWLTRLAAAAPLLLALGAGLAAGATRYLPRMRPWVASVWEVLTFWPRRFHPLAITPYSEIVVPQLQLQVVDAGFLFAGSAQSVCSLNRRLRRVNPLMPQRRTPNKKQKIVDLVFLVVFIRKKRHATPLHLPSKKQQSIVR